MLLIRIQTRSLVVLDFNHFQALKFCLAPFTHVIVARHGIGDNDEFFCTGTGVIEESGNFLENEPEVVSAGFGTLLNVRLQIGHSALMS